jgi:TrmH family RNA methyltransferase
MFSSFAAYTQQHRVRDVFPFMLDGTRSLRVSDCPVSTLYTLVFGNEATGLDASFRQIGQSVVIPQTAAVDSLNLPIAVGIGVFSFTTQNPRTD